MPSTPRSANGGARHGTVRISIFCLLLFYLFAAASPVIAPYDPTQQYRNLPDCPPMRLHLQPPCANGRTAFFFAYPMKMSDPMARRFVRGSQPQDLDSLFPSRPSVHDRSRADPYFMLGSEGPRPRSLFAHRIWRARQHVYRTGRRVDQFFAGYHGRRILRLHGRHDRQSDHALVRDRDVAAEFYFLLALAAVIPSGMSTVATFFMIVAIMAFISWAGFARVIRGMAAAVRSAPYVEAGRALGGFTHAPAGAAT